MSTDHLETARLQAERLDKWVATTMWIVIDTRESSIGNGSVYFGPTSLKADAVKIANDSNKRNIYGPCYVVVQLVPAT